MHSYCTDYTATTPDITIQMNCDTILAINLDMLNLGDNDEFIFTMKNYDYVDSSYVFLFKASKNDVDENGEVLFKIPSATSKNLKPGAFYNFSVLVNAFDAEQETLYKKLSSNGRILLDYGMQDLVIKTELSEKTGYEIVDVRLELVD